MVRFEENLDSLEIAYGIELNRHVKQSARDEAGVLDDCIGGIVSTCSLEYRDKRLRLTIPHYTPKDRRPESR